MIQNHHINMRRRILKLWKLLCAASGLLIIIMLMVINHGMRHTLQPQEVIKYSKYDTFSANKIGNNNRTFSVNLTHNYELDLIHYRKGEMKKSQLNNNDTNIHNRSAVEFADVNITSLTDSQTTTKAKWRDVKTNKYSVDNKFFSMNVDTKLTPSEQKQQRYPEDDTQRNPIKLFMALFQPEENEKYFRLVQRDAEAANMSLETFLKHAGTLNVPKESLNYIYKRVQMAGFKDGGNRHSGTDRIIVRPTLYSKPDVNITKPERVTYIHKIWQRQEGQLHIFLYSAFYDDRPALNAPQIRVISVAESSVENVICLLWLQGQSFPDVAKAAKIEIGPKISPTLQKQYESYLFSCEINGEPTYRPEYVSIVTTLQPKPTNVVRIHYPEKPPASERIEFGHCMSIVYWRHEPSRIVEWMELHKMWGIGEFNVYVNSLDSKIRAIFEKYAQEGIMNIYDLPNVLEDKDNEWVILLNMSPAINDCLYRNMYRYRYIVCTDTDEMIVPVLHGNYPAMINSVNTHQHSSSHPHPSYMFRNVYFFTDLQPAFKYPKLLHTQRFLRHIELSTFGYSAKSITDPQACIGLQNHLCWKRIEKFDNRGWLVDVRPEFGMNFHYKKCHFDAYLEKPGECDRMMANYTEDHTMRQFKRELYPRVKQVLQKLNLF